jgi:regulatory protein
MEDVGLVDDEEFARGWVESRQARRYLSRTALRRELKAKGVAQDHIESALETVDGEDEYAVAMALAQRKARAMAGLEREVQYRRLGGVLGRRGFDAALTSRVLAQVLNTPSEPAEDRSARSPGA